jgi:hypothetical protein
MQVRTPKHIELYLKIIIAIAAGVLVFLSVQLVGEYRHLRRLNYIGAHGSFLSASRAHGPISASDASSTQAWMTFDYINHLFALPSVYLQTSLAITDSRYPRLTIASYAKTQHLDQSTLLMQVQDAIRAHFVQTSQ